MNNLWKRSLSLLLALVMVLGILPMGIQVKAAEETDLAKADGVVWLVKDENYEIMGQKLGITEELMNKITGGELDDMIREALNNNGIEVDDSVVVMYDGEDLQTIGAKAMKLVEMGQELKTAITEHKFITFDVGGTNYDIAFRNHTNLSFVQKVDDGECVTLTDTLTINYWGVPADATARKDAITDELENILVSHNGYVSLETADAEWKINSNGTKLTLTVCSDDNDAEKTVTLNVVFEDIRPEYRIVFKNGDEIVLDKMVKEGEPTPVPADLEDTDEAFFFGWGEVAEYVYADATYEAVWKDTQVIKFHVTQTSGAEKVYSVALDENGNLNSYPETPDYKGYIGEGWFYIADGEYVTIDLPEGPFSYAVDGSDEPVLITDLYYIYCTDTDGDNIGDGMPADPRYIYDFYIWAEGEEGLEEVLGETVVLEEPINTAVYQEETAENFVGIAAPEVFEYNPQYLSLYLNGWAVYKVEVLNLGGITKYEVKPVTEADTNQNGLPDSAENGEVKFEGIDGLEAKKIAQDGNVITYQWLNADEEAVYQSTVEISGLSDEGTFIYTAGVTSVKVSPLWKIENGEVTGKMGYYVTGIGSESIAYENNYAYNILSDVAAANEENVLTITYAQVTALTINVTGSLEAGQDYTSEQIYNMVVESPEYEDADAVEIRYQSRQVEQKVEINFDAVYNYMINTPFASYAEELKDKIVEITLQEKWDLIGEDIEILDAQAVADAFFNDVIAQLEKKDFDVNFAVQLLGTMEADLKAELQAKANLRKFNNAEGTEKLDITYITEAYTLNGQAEIEVVDNRIATQLVAGSGLSFGYNCFTDADLLANVELVDADGNEIEGATLNKPNFYSRASAGTYTVEVSFHGNKNYKPAESVSFQLEITKVAPVIRIPTYEITFDDVYDFTPSVSPANVDYIQITAGVKASEFKFNSDLTLADKDIVVEVWIKLPAMYAKLINGLEVPGTDYVIETGVLYKETDIRSYLNQAKGQNEVLDKAIAAYESVMDNKLVTVMIDRLGLENDGYSVEYRLDSIEEKRYPTDPGLYVNFAASTAYIGMLGEYAPADYKDLVANFKNDNYIVSTDLPTAADLKGLTSGNAAELQNKVKNLSADGGIIVYSPMFPIPNSGGVQLYDGEISNAQNVFTYTYNGKPVDVDLEVAVNGEKIDGAEVTYYGLSTRFDAKKTAPTMPGVYVAYYNYVTTTYNEDTQEFETKRLGSDSCIIVIKQQPADLTITGGVYEYTGESILPEITLTDKDGNKIADSGMTIISGTVNVNTEDGENVTANDLYGAINVDFPDGLTIPYMDENGLLKFRPIEEAWNEYCAGKDLHNATITPSIFVDFLQECSEKCVTANEYFVAKVKELGVDAAIKYVVDAANTYQDTFEIGTDKIEAKIENVQNLMKHYQGTFDELVAQLEPYAEKLDDNCWITFQHLEDLDYSATGYYLYVGVITDPDLTVDAAKGLVVIKSADDYEMKDTDVAYNGEPQNILITDTTKRGDVTFVIDRKLNEVKFFLDSDMFKAVNTVLENVLGEGINEGTDGYVSTAYTKSEAVAEKVAKAMIDVLKTEAVSRVNARFPEGGEALDEALDILDGKLETLISNLSEKLQEIDKLPNDTRIILYEKSNNEDLYGMPVNVGTYEFYGYDYDVAAARGTLTIHPVTITVAFDGENFGKVVNAEEPELSGYVKVTYSCEETGETWTEWPTADKMSEVFSYSVSRAEGEEVGEYAMTITAELLGEHATSGNYVIEVGEDEVFEITEEVVVGTIGLGEWRMELDAVVYLNYYPTLEGFSDNFDFADPDRAGVVIWTGDNKPDNRYQIEVGKPDTMVIEGMKWNETTEEWFVQTHEIYAKNLGDKVYIRPYIVDNAGNYVYLNGAPYYSPAEFCYDVMNEVVEGQLNQPEGKRYVCAALLEYGASAQVYFGYETENLVTTIPEKFTNIDMGAYNLAYNEEYFSEMVVDDHVKALAATLKNIEGEQNKVGVTYTKGVNQSVLDLAGAIRLTTGFNIDTSVIKPEEIAKAEVLFWNERDFANITAEEGLAYSNHNYNYKYDLLKASGNEEVYVGDYRAQSDYILAKYLGETVYFTCRIEMNDGTAYNSGLVYYSPEAFAHDHIMNSQGQVVTVCERIIVYSEMAYNWFIGK